MKKHKIGVLSTKQHSGNFFDVHNVSKIHPYKLQTWKKHNDWMVNLKWIFLFRHWRVGLVRHLFYFVPSYWVENIKKRCSSSVSKAFTLNDTGSLKALFDERKSILIILRYLTALKLIAFEGNDNMDYEERWNSYIYLNTWILKKESIENITVSLKWKYHNKDVQHHGTDLSLHTLLKHSQHRLILID